MNIKDFKDEFRLVCSDTWGTALDAWFECAGQMYKRGMPIPFEWEYSAGMGDGTDEESYFHELFETATEQQLIDLGNYLFRYCEYLRFKGVDY